MRRLLALTAALLAAGLVIAQDETDLPETPPDETTPITKLVLVPAGEFTMGWPGSDEMPAHRVRVDAFMLDEHEVTNEQYKAYCDATGAKLPVYWGMEEFRSGDEWLDHPVVGVSHGAARKYARWVGKRLPSEAEWEYAARAGTKLKYAVTDTINPDLANYKSSKRGGPVAVKSYPGNPFGLYDLIGNVREWSADFYGIVLPEGALIPDEGEGPLDGVVPMENPVNIERNKLGIVRGGGWYSGGGCNSAYVRNGYPRGWGDFAVGFRCARSVD